MAGHNPMIALERPGPHGGEECEAELTSLCDSGYHMLTCQR